MRLLGKRANQQNRVVWRWSTLPVSELASSLPGGLGFVWGYVGLGYPIEMPGTALDGNRTRPGFFSDFSKSNFAEGTLMPCLLQKGPKKH